MSGIDAAIFRALHAAMSGTVVLWIMAAFTILGSGWTMIAFVPLLAIARTRRFAFGLIATLSLTGVVVWALKNVAHRARPCACLDGIHARIFQAPTDYSFPSGHAAGSFAFAAFVATLVLLDPSRRYRWRIVALVFGLAVGVALSRVALGVHFPGDIAAGALVGGLLGTLGARIHAKGKEPNRKAT